MKKYRGLNKEDHVISNSGVEEAIKKFGMTRKKFHNPKEMSWLESRKLETGQSYINKRGKIAWRQTFQEDLGDWFWTILGWLLFPFTWIGRKIGRAFHNFFYLKTNFQNNGIIGPGYASWHEEHFSWGKLSFVLVIGFIIVYFIFLR